MAQVVILYGFNETSAYMSATFLTQARYGAHSRIVSIVHTFGFCFFYFTFFFVILVTILMAF
jgi:hypothetical protein